MQNNDNTINIPILHTLLAPFWFFLLINVTRFETFKQSALLTNLVLFGIPFTMFFLHLYSKDIYKKIKG